MRALWYFTLYFELLGEEELYDLSSIPKNFALQKRNAIDENLIIDLRKERKLGARRIQSELKRLHDISYSTATIHKVLIESKSNATAVKYREKECKWTFTKLLIIYINILQ